MFAFENEDKVAELKKGQMNSLQILEKAGYPPLSKDMSFDEFLGKVAGWIQDPNHKLIQIENTLFLVTIINRDVCQISVISADNENDQIEAIKGIVKTLKRQGFKKMMGYAKDQKYLQLANKTGLPFKIETQDKMTDGKMEKIYVFELDL